MFMYYVYANICIHLKAFGHTVSPSATSNTSYKISDSLMKQITKCFSSEIR